MTNDGPLDKTLIQSKNLWINKDFSDLIFETKAFQISNAKGATTGTRFTLKNLDKQMPSWKICKVLRCLASNQNVHVQLLQNKTQGQIVNIFLQVKIS